MSAHCKHDSALHLLQGLRAHALRWGRAQERLPRRRPIGYFKKTKDQNAPANASYFWHGAGSAFSAEERATLMSRLHELRVVDTLLRLFSLEVVWKGPQQTRIYTETYHPRNADDDGLSGSECTSLVQIGLIVVLYVFASEPTNEDGHSIRSDDRGHCVLERHLPTQHLVPVLPCYNLSKNWEIAARLGPICQQVEERVDHHENPQGL